jgi:branched-chain amino acid transport system permease protein
VSTVTRQPTASPPAPELDLAAVPWRGTPWAGIGFGLVVGLMLPWVLARLAIGNYVIHLLILFFVWSVVAQTWNLIMGYGGIYSFAQIALLAVGGWTTAVLSTAFGWNPWLSILLAPIGAVLAALLVGLPTLRLRGAYVVLLTLAFQELLRTYTINGPRIISGGGYGLTSVPKFDFGDIAGPNKLVFFYYVALALFVVGTYAVWRVIRSPYGIAVTALRDSETYAVSRGIDQFRIRLFLFGFSAFFTGLAGGVLTHYVGGISTSIFDFGQLINLLAMIVIGGWATFEGPIFGTALLLGLNEWLRDLGDFRVLAVGLALAFIAVFAPQGLYPILRRWLGRLLGGGAAPPVAASAAGEDTTAPVAR